MNPPNPELILQFMTGGWAASLLGTAARHGVFTALEGSPDTAAGLAQKIGVSARGAQALLDGLAGLSLLTSANGRYANSPAASAFLVKGQPAYLGDMAEVFLEEFGNWQRLPEAVKTGQPVVENLAEVADNPFWHVLVTAIAPLSFPVAQDAAARLGVPAAGPVSWLDIGGGSGVWSAAWLLANPQATGTQLDWAKVNEIGRGYVSRFGVADRFKTIDGDFHTTDFGTAKYDFVIYSHIAHQESPAENVATFRKVRAALKPGGAFVVNDFVLGDDRTGHPFSMMFTANMLLATKAGASYRAADYRAWLTEAGFTAAELVPTQGPPSYWLAR